METTWTVEQLREAARNNVTMSGILKCLGLRPTGTMYIKIRNKAKEHNISLEHLIGRAAVNLSGNRIQPFENILVENSSYTSTSNLKRRLLNAGKMVNKCYVCGIGPIWNGQTLVMVLDHINGKNTDNRLENLRLLCPNCNSQQSTFAGRNKKAHAQKIYCINCNKLLKENSKSGLCCDCYRDKKSSESFDNCVFQPIDKQNNVNRPSLEILVDEVKSGGYKETGKKYGVSDSSIKSWLEDYGCKFPRKSVSKTGMKGVSKVRNKWQARIAYKGTTMSLGSFNTPEEAQAVYRLKRQELGLSE